MEAVADRSNKWSVQMGLEEVVKVINVNGSDDLEEMGCSHERVECDSVSELVSQRRWKRRHCFYLHGK
jgi:hypothetical protein